MGESGNVQSRREMLARIVKGGALVGSLSLLDLTNKVTAASATTRRRSGVMQISPYAADGLLTMYVEGTFVGLQGSSMILSVTKPGVGAVKVLVPASTPVTVRGVQTRGDLSSCQLGDVMAVGTVLTAQGTRVAQWVYANFVAATAIVQAIGTNAATVSPGPKYSRKFGPDFLNSSGQLTIMPYTSLDMQSLSAVGSVAVLQPQQRIYFTGTSTAPFAGAQWPVQIWAVRVFEMVFANSPASPS